MKLLIQILCLFIYVCQQAMAGSLFTPLQLGAIRVPNRVFMAPLTRLRSIEPGDIPTPLSVEYYRQRATAGLIISEATHVSFQGKGYAGAPGQFTSEQITAWKAVTEAVHAKGGRIAIQLWHSGRISHSSLHGGCAPVAPSAIKAKGRTTLRDAEGRPIRVETSVPRALTKSEIADIVQDFRQAVIYARNESSFDMVELHGAHGYLIHQFLSPLSNQRDDEYGGSVENRTRFVLEVVDAMIDGWRADRIGVRISPLGPFNDILELEDREDAWIYLIKELAKRNIAFLHVSELDWAGAKPYKESFRRRIREAFPGVIVAAGSYTKEKGEELIDKGLIDAVAFGRDYIANPDLVERLQKNATLNTPRKELFYGGGAEGYIDYPTLLKN